MTVLAESRNKVLAGLRFIFISRSSQSSSQSGVGRRLPWPDIARGIAIILVVLHHTIQWLLLEQATDPVWSAVTEFLRTMRMPLFFCISGIFAASWISRKSWRELIAHKLLLLFWVYITWCTIRWLYFLIAPRRGTPEPFYFSRLLAAPFWPTNELWFLYALIVFFVFAKLFYRIPMVNFVLAFLASAVALSGLIHFPNGAVEGVCSYYLLFLVGLYGREFILNWVPRMRLLALLLLCTLWFGSYLLVHLLSIQAFPGIGVILRLFGLSTGLLLAHAVGRVRGTSWLSWMGRNTLPVYVCHVLWIVPLVVLVGLVSPGPSAPIAYFYPLVICFVAIAGSLLIWLLTRKLGLNFLYFPPKFVGRLLSNRLRLGRGKDSSLHPEV
ncbi:acyltransferase family protein [Rhodococcus sp. 14-2470-1a]|uniref:acyltransferase family protein n=1 Tax=Rhodococcus sp. 14-2470-1a TaxID=2023150 RepID=UPI000B9BAC97|nr:acyltransferase family protein [Rhodococcus sp. 14-2470-1a]OZF55494.1 hypothetical protein CH292_05935 [Rhodococcus sp. 14-2470-1a]